MRAERLVAHRPGCGQEETRGFSSKVRGRCSVPTDGCRTGNVKVARDGTAGDGAIAQRGDMHVRIHKAAELQRRVTDPESICRRRRRGLRLGGDRLDADDFFMPGARRGQFGFEFGNHGLERCDPRLKIIRFRSGAETCRQSCRRQQQGLESTRHAFLPHIDYEKEYPLLVLGPPLAIGATTKVVVRCGAIHDILHRF